jgi:hypothetical protein
MRPRAIRRLMAKAARNKGKTVAQMQADVKASWSYKKHKGSPPKPHPVHQRELEVA